MIIDPTFQIILGAEMALLDGDVPVPAPFHRTVALHKPAGVVCARAKRELVAQVPRANPPQLHLVTKPLAERRACAEAAQPFEP